MSLEQLKQWAVNALAPLSDADPHVLADYAVALLRNPADSRADLEALLASQLAEFLCEDPTAFVSSFLSKVDELGIDLSSAQAPAPIPQQQPSVKRRRIEPIQRATPYDRPQQPAEICRDYHCARGCAPTLTSNEDRGFCPRGVGCRHLHDIPGGLPPNLMSRPASSPRRVARSRTVLVVEKIPAESLAETAVRSWFERYGAVSTVSVDAAQARATVTFEQVDAAQSAYKSSDAIFGNRFVRLHFQPEDVPPPVQAPLSNSSQAMDVDPQTASLEDTLRGLRQEAAELGLDTSRIHARGSGLRGRGTRGRARARGSMTWSNRSYKLDLRTKSISITLSDGVDPAPVREQLEAVGASSLEPANADGVFIARFDSHEQAAKALAASSSLDGCTASWLS